MSAGAPLHCHDRGRYLEPAGVTQQLSHARHAPHRRRNNPVLWRAFYTNAIVMLTLRGLLNFCSNNRCGFFSVGGFIIFEIREGQTDFSLKELFPLFLLGVTGGIMGSLFTVANMAISRWRRDVLPKYGKRGKLLEALAIAFVTSTCSFMLCKASDGTDARASCPMLCPLACGRVLPRAA